MWIHRLLSKDIEAKTGICKKCGSVPIRYRGNWRCSTGIKESARETSAKGNKTQPHGLTIFQAKEFRKGKHCSICGDIENLVVDHCHATKLIRGVLCRNCNAGIGLLKDDAAMLRKAIDYLNSNK